MYRDDQPDFDRLDALPVFVVHLDEYKKQAVQSVTNTYEPIGSIKEAGHFLTFWLFTQT